MKLLPRVLMTVLFVALLVPLVGCPFSTKPGGGEKPDPLPTFKPRTHPDSLLQNLMLAYELRVPAEFESLLARDFVFQFSDIDVQDPDVPSDDLAREDEVGIHQRMFDATLVQNLTLSFEYAISSLEVDELLSSPQDTLWTLLLTNVDLLLYGGTPQHPDEPESYELEDGVEQFWFRKNSWTHTNGDPIWTIVRWKEHNFGGGGGGKRGAEPLP